MAEPPELLAFLASNLLVFVLGGSMATLSYRAYRRTGTPSFRTAAAGFALITAGSLVEAVYELGIRGTSDLGGRELLALHAVEGFLISLGLAGLFYSLWRY